MLRRDCERKCTKCGQLKHHSRFRNWRDYRNSTVSVTISSICRDCDQKARNEKKNIDRPLAIIQQRASAAASKAGVSREFFWINMNYRSLVPELRGLMTPEGLCKGCGHQFINERDIQIEHIEPPRFPNDWARLHSRNIRLCCGSCNRTKGRKPFSQWLDEQEGARRTNHEQQDIPPADSTKPQLTLF